MRRRTERRNDGRSCLTLSQSSVLPPSVIPSSHQLPARLHTAAPQHGTLAGNLCLDTRCNYYNQSYEWRKSSRLLHEKGRAHLLGGAVVRPLLGGQLIRRRAGMVAIGRVSGSSATGGARGAGGAVLSQRRNQLPHEARTRFCGRAPAEANGWDAVYHKLRRRGRSTSLCSALRRGFAGTVRTSLMRASSWESGFLSTGDRRGRAALKGAPLSDETIATATDAAYRHPSRWTTPILICHAQSR